MPSSCAQATGRVNAVTKVQGSQAKTLERRRSHVSERGGFAGIGSDIYIGRAYEII